MPNPPSSGETAPHPRRLEIIEAAILCFIEAGYHQSGMRDIAKRAGVSLGNLYNHFEGKTAILAEIARLEGVELEAFETLLASREDPSATLARFTEAYAAYAARMENAVLGVEILAEALRSPAVADLFRAARERLTRALARLLEAGQAQGRFRAFSAPEETARMILDLIEGHALRRHLGWGGGGTGKALREAVEGLTHGDGGR